MMPEEIWFRKWLWSYVPVHWKGLVLIFATVVAVLTSFAGLVILHLHPVGPPKLVEVAIIPKNRHCLQQ